MVLFRYNLFISQPIQGFHNFWHTVASSCPSIERRGIMITINRREFLKRATALGLSASSAMALLEACGGGSSSSTSGPVTVNLYHTIPAATETYWKQTLLPPFEKQNPGM